MGLMPGFGESEDEEGGDGSNGNGNGNGKKKREEDGGKGEDELAQTAPVDPLLAAMLATVVFDTTPLPAAAVNPLDDSGKSLLKLAPVKAFPSVRLVGGGGSFFLFFLFSKQTNLKTLGTPLFSLSLSFSSSNDSKITNRTCSRSAARS